MYKENIRKRFWRLNELSKQGDSNAMYELSEIYLNAEDKSKYIDKDIAWFIRDDEIVKDIDLAIYWLEQSCSPKAQYKLAEMYLYGKYIIKDTERAFDLFLETAKYDHYPPSMHMIGVMYLNGYGTIKDYDKALYWLYKAIERGDSDAMVTIAQMYLHGQKFKINGEKAVHWLKKAADLGNIEAMYQLCEIFRNGYYIDGKPNRINEWFVLLAERL